MLEKCEDVENWEVSRWSHVCNVSVVSLIRRFFRVHVEVILVSCNKEGQCCLPSACNCMYHAQGQGSDDMIGHCVNSHIVNSFPSTTKNTVNCHTVEHFETVLQLFLLILNLTSKQQSALSLALRPSWDLSHNNSSWVCYLWNWKWQYSRWQYPMAYLLINIVSLKIWAISLQQSAVSLTFRPPWNWYHSNSSWVYYRSVKVWQY